jgi:hypothetical protein
MTKKEAIKKDKEKVLEMLRGMPIVEVACKKSGIGRSTYYRWKSEDPEFAKASDDALDDGVALINDMTESQLIALIKERKFQAVQFWLKHNHGRFLLREKEHSLFRPQKDLPLSKEQQKVLGQALKVFT